MNVGICLKCCAPVKAETMGAYMRLEATCNHAKRFMVDYSKRPKPSETSGEAVQSVVGVKLEQMNEAAAAFAGQLIAVHVANGADMPDAFQRTEKSMAEFRVHWLKLALGKEANGNG